MKTTEQVYFVYSEMQLREDKKIYATLSKSVTPGKVSVGDTLVEYTKIIKQDYLSEMAALYPDVKIVAEGKYGDMKYTDIEVSPISGN